MGDRGHEQTGMSRRTFAGMGAAAAALAALPGGVLAAPAGAAAAVAPGRVGASALGTVNPALTYLGLDAFAFHRDTMLFSGPSDGRVYQDLTGIQPLVPPGYLSAPLPIPAGSTIHQLNVAYLGTPILEVCLRSMTEPTPFTPVFQQTTLAMPETVRTITFDLATPITVAHGTTASIRIFFSAADSVLGVTVGYLPPAQSFVPFTGGAPRVLDTRTAGGKLADAEERVVALGFSGARGAVLNVTVTETEGTGGFVAVYPANVPWPGNSSVNWSGPGLDVANGVITALDGDGAIKLRGGANRTHVIIDRIGWLV